MKILLYISALSYATSACFAETTIEINNNPAAPLTALAHVCNNNADSVLIRFISSKHTFNYGRKYCENFPIIGLHSDNHYNVTFELYAKGKKIETSKTQHLTTPALPQHPALMPQIIVTTSNPGKMEPGYTLFNPRRDAPRTNSLNDSFNQAYGLLMATNHNGDIVWYYTCDSRISDFNILDNGNISYLTQDNTLVEIDWSGTILNQWYASKRPQKKESSATPVEAETMHHDVTTLPNGNMITLGTQWRELPHYWTDETSTNTSTQKVMGDIVYEFDRHGQVIWSWNVFDYLNPYVAGYETFHAYWQRRGYPDVRADWSHANAVVYDPQSDAVLVNFRHLSLIIKINRKTKDIIWAFGHHTELLKDKSKYITLNSGSFPWHQHSPEITPNGNLLFFNNDNYKAYLPHQAEKVQASYSYANEYAIDQKSMTAQEVWSSRQNSDTHIISVAMGDVDHLPQTGNILVAYGQLLNQAYVSQMKSWADRNGTWTMMREFSHTTPAEILWEMRLEKLNQQTNIGWNLFGAERFTF